MASPQEPDARALADEEIVALAYAMAIGPDRFYDLFDALATRIEERIAPQNDMAQVSDLVSSSLGSLEPHFEKALGLMHRTASKREKPNHTIQAIEHDTRPNALVYVSGDLKFANAAAEALGFRAHAALQPEHFEEGQHPQLLTALSTLGAAADGQLIGVFGVICQTTREPLKMGLRRVRDDQGQVLGHLTALNTTWQPETAEQFRRLMKLTPAELEVVRAVVTGLSLSDLAAQRKRAVGTVRLQAKKLLAKLHLRSQTELACFYTGFSELHAPTKQPETPPKPGASRLLKLRDGRLLDYETAGPANGRPVFFLPALLGGTALTPAMYQALFEKKLRLISVWRPGMAQTTEDRVFGPEAFARHSADLAELMDMLSIPSAPVIGHITSAMFAFAAAAEMPDRIERLALTNPTVPCWAGPHVSKLDPRERLRFIILRRVPKVGRMVVHALLAKIEAGYDEEFLSAFLDNEIDVITMQDPDIRGSFRDALKKTIAGGYDAFVRELTIGGLDWRPYVEQTTCPVTMLVGAQNPIYTPKILRLFAQEHAHLKVREIPQTAHLLLYQAFDEVLAAVLDQT